MKKVFSLFFVLFIFPFSLFSYDADSSLKISSYAFFSSLVSHFSTPEINLAGVYIMDDEFSFPEIISFVRSDISSYKESLNFLPEDKKEDIVNRFLSAVFSSPEFEKEGIILDGTVRRESLEYYSSERIVFDISFSLLISVTNVFEGNIRIYLNKDEISLYSKGLYLDGKEYNFSPLKFKVGSVEEIFK